MRNDAFIIAGVRTPIGSMGGSLSTVPAVELGATCIKAALERAGIAGDDVNEVIMGNVVSAGIGQNPARQAAIKAGLPVSVGATTVNKVCGSGLKAVMFATQTIRLGYAQVVVAGGMENMSLAPYLLPQARQGYRMGNGVLVDSMIHDGLWDVYGDKHMGIYGDQCAAKYGFTKQAQDDFAVTSYTRARRAIAEGVFDDEIVPVEIKSKKGSTIVREDEEPSRFNEDKLRALRPAFGAEGTVTAGNASSINDGAAALVCVSDARCASLRVKPLARIVGATTFSREPEWFTIAPIGALKKLMDKVNWAVKDVDAFEINEAFSAVAMAAEKELELPHEKVNIYGGAAALGHPIGCSGARILVTLLTALRRTGGTRGIACLCIGGGEAVALAVETCEK
jgi:acetyl-CoA C-acetyltransferase